MRNKLFLALFFLFFSLEFFSCAGLHSVSITPIPANRKKEVSATVSKFVFLGLSFDNDFVDELAEELKRKCKGGKISGILTKDESFFYFIAHTRKVTATGFCIQDRGEI